MSKTYTFHRSMPLLAAFFLTGALFAGGTRYYYYKDTYCGKGNDGYNAAMALYNADLKTYNETLYPAWLKSYNEYNAYKDAKKVYDDKYAEYLKNKAAWESATGASGVGAKLDATSYVTGHPDRRIVTNLTEDVVVPSFSDIATYRSYCQNYVLTNGVKGGRIVCRNRYADNSGEHAITFTHTGDSREEWWSSGEGPLYRRDATRFYSKALKTVSITRTVASLSIAGGYAGGVYPFTDKIAGVSDACEKNSAVLIGTLRSPIEIEGPVYFDGDVVIRGFVKGQGSIYAGRNIHIIGDITYYDPPSWPHDMDDLKKAEFAPAKVKVANASKNLLLLAARGNIIVGDYTSTEWTNASQMAYLNLNGATLKAHGTSETDIGYTSGYPKNRNYAEYDGGKTIDGQTVTDGPNKYGSIPNTLFDRYYYVKTYDYDFRTRDRRYYESSLGAVAIQNLKQTSATIGTQPSWRDSTTLWKRILTVLGQYQESQTVTDNTDSGDVTEIDALLYANHGIFGVAGGTVSKKLHLNGAMICRDEGLLTSFAGRFKDDSAAKAWINWDMRIKSDLDGGVHIGAPERESSSSGIKVKRVTWSYTR